MESNDKGEVLDSTTNEPLLGASVLLIGTTLGAATDASMARARRRAVFLFPYLAMMRTNR